MIRVGIGGWVYAPWNETFYPPGLRKGQELAHASRHLTAIEINATFYSGQKPETFRKWAAETPDDFMFTVKAHRSAVSGKLAAAGPAVERFVFGGLAELGAKLGPILWQFSQRKFAPDDMAAFLDLLPTEVDGRRLRHALEVRHASFVDPAFVALARSHGAAVVLADSDTHPLIPDITADFVYARLQRCRAAEPAGYPPAELDRQARLFTALAAGGNPTDLPLIDPAAPVARQPRDCFVFMISGDKERAPAAAQALIARLGR